MGQVNVDVVVLQETKLIEGIYTQKSDGYKVVATPAPSRHQGGIALFYWDSPSSQSRQYASLAQTLLHASCQWGRGTGTSLDFTWRQETV